MILKDRSSGTRMFVIERPFVGPTNICTTTHFWAIMRLAGDICSRFGGTVRPADEYSYTFWSDHSSGRQNIRTHSAGPVRLANEYSSNFPERVKVYKYLSLEARLGV